MPEKDTYRRFEIHSRWSQSWAESPVTYRGHVLGLEGLFHGGEPLAGRSSAARGAAVGRTRLLRGRLRVGGRGGAVCAAQSHTGRL